MQLGEQIFNAIYASLPDGRASLSFVDGSFDCAAVCSSVSSLSKATVEGFGFSFTDEITIVKSVSFDAVFPTIEACISKMVEYTKITDNVTKKGEIKGNKILSGALKLYVSEVA
jgi:hypothetical protein